MKTEIIEYSIKLANGSKVDVEFFDNAAFVSPVVDKINEAIIVLSELNVRTVEIYRK